tara:strand:+ start:71 stop:1126 length:1056 start_codon:yes stop_codon:yes gene_type:complete
MSFRPAQARLCPDERAPLALVRGKARLQRVLQIGALTADQQRILENVQEAFYNAAGVNDTEKPSLDQRQDTSKVCIRSTQAQNACSGDVQFTVKLNEDLLQALQKLPENRMIKMLWTGWVHDAQRFACVLADQITAAAHEGGVEAYAIEQTSYATKLINSHGTWDAEYEKLQQEYRNAASKKNINLEENEEDVKKRIEAIRKGVWDRLSLKWAQDDRFKYAIAILPSPGQDFNINATLPAIEMHHLSTDTKLCLMTYNCEAGFDKSDLDIYREYKQKGSDAVDIVVKGFNPQEHGFMLELRPAHFTSYDPKLKTWPVWTRYLALVDNNARKEWMEKHESGRFMGGWNDNST